MGTKPSFLPLTERVGHPDRTRPVVLTVEADRWRSLLIGLFGESGRLPSDTSGRRFAVLEPLWTRSDATAWRIRSSTAATVTEPTNYTRLSKKNLPPKQII